MPTSRALVAVALGGATGALLRYAALVAVPPPAPPGVPWTVLAVNVLGCLAMGLLMGWLHERPGVPAVIRPFLGTGVCGGFTTFSTLALDSSRLAGPAAGTAAAYVAATLLCSFAALAVGFSLVRRLLPLPPGVEHLADEPGPTPEEGEP